MAGAILSTGGLEKSQNALVGGRQLCAQLSIFKAELLCFLMLSSLRSLAELLRFGWCQVQKLRKSRRIASFWMLSKLNNEEVSQNSFVFKLADRQVDRQTDRERERERKREIDR